MSDIKNTSYPKEKINILLLENISDRAVSFLNSLVTTQFANCQGHYQKNN
jgi:hypothetical protein